MIAATIAGIIAGAGACAAPDTVDQVDDTEQDTGGSPTGTTPSSPDPSTSSSTEPSADPLDPDTVLRTPSTTPGKHTSPVVRTPVDPVDTDTTGEFPLDVSSPRVQATVDDLAERLGIPRAEIMVVEARAVTWGDSSLGCPRPGMQYLPRLIDGSLVILEAQGQTFEYHGGDPLFLCE